MAAAKRAWKMNRLLAIIGVVTAAGCTLGVGTLAMESSTGNGEGVNLRRVSA